MATKKNDAAVEQTVAPSVVDEVTPVVETVATVPDVTPESPVVDAPTVPDAPVVPDTHEAVNLVGTPGQKTGEHGVYAGGHVLAMFKDGVAIVEKEVAKLLKELGVAE